MSDVAVPPVSPPDQPEKVFVPPDSFRLQRWRRVGASEWEVEQLGRWYAALPAAEQTFESARVDSVADEDLRAQLDYYRDGEGSVDLSAPPDDDPVDDSEGAADAETPLTPPATFPAAVKAASGPEEPFGHLPSAVSQSTVSQTPTTII